MADKPEGKTGAEAFGFDPDGRPTGSLAIGCPDQDDPLRGALLFGNDPKGGPRGSESFGGADEQNPLRGALLFGNDPKGGPRGSETFGGPDEKLPLRGALLFGNDPQGQPRGSEAFGNPDAQLNYRGAQAFGAPQLFRDLLPQDDVGYDFVRVMLTSDDGSLAGIRKDPRNRIRERVLKAVVARLGIDADRLRQGLRVADIPWSRLGRDKSLDPEFADAVKKWSKNAPGEMLGVGHMRDLLESMGRLHTLHVQGEWEQKPVQVHVVWHELVIAHGLQARYGPHYYYPFKDPSGRVLGYVDAVTIGRREQLMRVRDDRGARLATVEIVSPEIEGVPGAPDKVHFRAVVRDREKRELCSLWEERSTSTFFRAKLKAADSDDSAGYVEDVIKGDKVRTTVELDFAASRVMAMGIATIFADLARLRRQNWPDSAEEPVETAEEIESIEEALGPRRRPKPPPEEP